MLNNPILNTILVGIFIGLVILVAEYYWFDDEKPTVIIVSEGFEIPPQFQSDKIEIVTLPPSKELPVTPAPLNFKINYLYRPVGDDHFKLLKTDSVLKSHDHYKIIFTPLEKSYVYIFQMDSVGQIYQLFPMKRFKNMELNNTNPVTPNITHYVPAKDKSFALDKQTGTETLYFIATRQPDLVLVQQYQKMAQHQNNAAQLKLAKAEFIKTLQQRKPTEITDDRQMFNWTEQGQSFMVVQQQLDGLCQNCVQTLTFNHR